MKLFPSRIRKSLKESRGVSGLRDAHHVFAGATSLMPQPSVGALRDTNVDYERVRELYYNTRGDLTNGAFFTKAIINGTADMIGLPICTVDDPNIDTLITNWVIDYWPQAIWEMYRNALRDTKTWVRIRKPFPSPFLGENESDAVELEILDADRVTPYYNPATQELERVEILTPTYMEDTPFDPQQNLPITRGRAQGRVHNIYEIITPYEFMYYDETKNTFLDRLTIPNDWGFVPLVEVFNDYDSALNGGTCDVETAFPFFKAFHDIVVQTRSAHEYHADPKVKMKINDVMPFIKNNFPEAFAGDQFTGKVNWKGKDIFFLEESEDIGFVEISTNPGDSVTLLEFFIDCICIAAEVTESILLRAKAEQPGETDELFRFKKKIERKRSNFTPYIQKIVKMAQTITTSKSLHPKVAWSTISIADLAAEGQALNQIVTAAEVANRANVISKQTYRDKIRHFFPGINSDSVENAQISTEVAQEQQQQIDLEKQLSAIKASNIPPTPSQNGSGGPNSARRLRPPIDLTVGGNSQ